MGEIRELAESVGIIAACSAAILVVEEVLSCSLCAGAFEGESLHSPAK